MKNRKGWLVGALMLLSLPAVSQVSFGQPEKINEQWRFVLGEPAEGAMPDFGREGKWVDLPHDWSVQGVLSPTWASATGYLPGGIGWYGKTLDIPAEKAGKRVYLYFEGVYNRSRVSVNGHALPERPNGYISFLHEITPYIEAGGENQIAVRVDHSRSADSRWYTGSGIYRNVWLVYADPIHIAPWGVYAVPMDLSARQGTLRVETEVENGEEVEALVTVIHELFAPDGSSVAKGSRRLAVPPGKNATVGIDLKVRNPQRWDLEHPHLYRLETTLMRSETFLDKTTTRTGFRSLSFDPDRGFALNGEWIKVKGVCIHHDAGVLGAAVPRQVWKRRLETLKSIGCNAVRTSHNPQAPDLYDLCDELGILVLDEAFDEWEFPKRKWLEGWNVGTPGFEGSYDFFEAWGERDMADLVRRDRNHPSVFAWSIGNEVDYPNDPYSHPILDGKDEHGFSQPIFGGYKPDAPDAMRLGAIARRLVAAVKQYDRSRPVTAGLAGVAMSNETEYPAALDIAGYNYTESRYESDHRAYPHRVIYGSENRHDLAAWKAVRDNEHIFGQFLWTGIDYLGESGRWPARGFYSGLLDFAGFIKPRGYFRQSLWSDQPMAYLGTYPTPGRGRRGGNADAWSQLESESEQAPVEKVPSMDAWPVWNYEEGESVRVVCYTNAARARLLLNDVPVGVEKPYDEETGIIYWDIPYRPGKLEVIGLGESGEEVARYAISSSLRPYALTLQLLNPEISRERGVAQIVVQVVDEAGVPVMHSDDLVTCTIEGPARLLGLEAGNNTDMSDYTDSEHRVYHGRILAYLEATGEGGDVKVRFTAPWLRSAETHIRVK